MPKRPGRKSAAQTPAPKSERIYGSAKNPAKSASSEKSASKISLSPKIIKSLSDKLAKFKETHNTKKVSLNDLKAVYRRGLGAYSSSHRPTITGGAPNTRNAWAMARVNKFLLKAGGTKVKAAYVQDDDLLKYEDGGETGKAMTFEEFSENLDKPKQEVIDQYEETLAELKDRYNKLTGTTKYSDSESMYMGRVGFSNKQQIRKKDAYFDKVLREGKDKAKIDEQISSLEKKLDLYKRGVIAENMMPKIPSIQKLKELIFRSDEILVSGEIKGVKLTDDQINTLREKISDWKKQLSDKTRKHKKLYQEYLKNPKPYKKGGQTESEQELIGIYKLQKMQQNTMENGGKIVSARITEMPEDYGDEMPKVFVTFEDGTEEMLFDYYPDEISFTPEEFVGLTPDEARHLKFEKDKHYLMYSNAGAEFKKGGRAFNDEELLKKYKKGESIGFTAIAHLKSKGLIPRADGTKRKSEYAEGGQTNENIVCVNCSWEWNTSDSDESDKYVCHKCGFDNTLFYTVFKETMTLDQIAEKHGVDMEYLQKQFEEGMQHEMDEHTKGGTELSKEVGEIIALHHLEEAPDYYEKLKNLDIESTDKESLTTGNIIEDDEFIEVHDFQEPDVEYVRYSVWYSEPGEAYDFYELSDAVEHIEQKNVRGIIRDFDGKKVMGYDDIEKVLNGQAFVKDYERGGQPQTEPELKTQYEINEFLAEQKEEADAVLFSRRTQIGKFMICNAYIDMAREKVKRAENALEQQVWDQVIYIWEQTKDEVDDVIYMYEEGGNAGGCGCTRYMSKKNYHNGGSDKMMEKGGLAYGNSHDKGGMPMKVKSTGQNIEIEGGEGVINKRSMQMTKKVEFEGKQMTPCEVISKINQMGGGVKFDCSDVKQIVEKDGEF